MIIKCFSGQLNGVYIFNYYIFYTFYEYFKNKFTKPKVYNIFNENYIEVV